MQEISSAAPIHRGRRYPLWPSVRYTEGRSNCQTASFEPLPVSTSRPAPQNGVWPFAGWRLPAEVLKLLWLLYLYLRRNRMFGQVSCDSAAFSLLPAPCPLLPAPCSPPPAPRSLPPAPCSPLPAPCSLPPAPRSLLPAPCSPLPAPCPLLPAPCPYVKTPWGTNGGAGDG